jgi:hypothetical protein
MIEDKSQSEMTEENEKPKRRRTFKVDSIILAIASLMLFISVFMLFADGVLFGGDDYSNLTKVGKFEVSKNDVRRRVDSGMTWGNASKNDIVFEGDSVFTGDSSEATVTLDNGTVLKIDPKSLVVIRTRGKNLEIDLQYGSLQGKLGGDGSIMLTQNGQTQELSGDNSELRIVKGENSSSVQVVSGQVSLKDGKKLNQDDELTLDKKGSKVSHSDITLLSPKNGESDWLPLGKTVTFKWKSAKPGFDGVFETSKDPAFTIVSQSVPVTGTSFSSGDSPDFRGPFYWRVRANAADSIPPVAWKISLYDDVPPLPVLPANEQVVRIPKNAKENRVSVFLTWEDSSGSNDFEVQTSVDETFAKPLATEHTTELVSKVMLGEGEFYWRVKGTHPDRKNAPWSRTMHFTVLKSGRDLEAPVLQVKNLEFNIPRAALPPVGEKVEHIAVTGVPAFQWTGVKGATGYVAEFATDDTFSNSQSIELDQALSYAPSKVLPGDAYFRVHANTKSGKAGNPSEVGILHIQLPAPVIGPLPDKKMTFNTKKEMDKAQHEFKITWEALPVAANYELVWGADPQFTKSKAFKISGTTKKIKVTKPREYAAKVRALDANDKPISPYSEVRVGKFEKELKKAVELPKIADKPKPPREPAAAFGLPGVKTIEPKADTSLVSLEHAPTFVRFQWHAFAKADEYLIQISEDADFTKLVKEKTVKRNAFVFEEALPEGKVFWRVRAKTKAGYSEWSDVAKINVLYR